MSVELYGKDLIVLKDVIKKVYKNSRTKPLVVAPGGFYEEKWYSELLRLSGPGVLDVLTHHIYNLGPGLHNKNKSIFVVFLHNDEF